jgi:branched-chain amino acid transport system permease protein
MQIVVLALALVLSAGLLIGLERTAAGRVWRAVSEDRRLAELCGVDTARTIALTVATSSAFAGVAGFIVAVYYGGVSFYMGLVLGLKALFATVIGGSGGRSAGPFLAVSCWRDSKPSGRHFSRSAIATLQFLRQWC